MHGIEIDPMAPKSNLSSVWTQRPGNDCDEGRLPRPVLAEQDVHLSPSQIEIDLVQRENPGKPTADPGQLQESRLLFREGAGARGRPLNRFCQAGTTQFTVNVGLNPSGASDEARSNDSMFSESIT